MSVRLFPDLHGRAHLRRGTVSDPQIAAAIGPYFSLLARPEYNRTAGDLWLPDLKAGIDAAAEIVCYAALQDIRKVVEAPNSAKVTASALLQACDSDTEVTYVVEIDLTRLEGQWRIAATRSVDQGPDPR